MTRIGILSFSDGRERVHLSLSPYISKRETELIQTLKGLEGDMGDIKVFASDTIINNAEAAKKEAEKMLAHGLNCVIFNVCVFAFPAFSAIARKIMDGVPCAVHSPGDPSYPGLGGLSAAVNMIRQKGMICEKIWGSLDEGRNKKTLLAFLRAANAVTRLKGSVYGLIGGRSIGMGSGEANADRWFSDFGVDTDHVDQSEILRLKNSVPEEKIDKAVAWLEKNTKEIQYNDGKLTKDSLREQIRCYYATKSIIDEKKLGFVGVKCHYDMSEYYCTQCISAAFFNDPYDWDGAKEPVVFSCEADSDGALTMQILKLITGKPVMFADFRYYDGNDNMFVFCNCGAMATWYAGQNGNPLENIKNVSLKPVIEKYGGKGSHVQFMAKECGEITLCRLTRTECGYRLTAFAGKIVKTEEEKMNITCPEWPHAYVSVSADPYELIDKYENNHVHGVPGNYLNELEKFCRLTGIEFLLIT